MVNAGAAWLDQELVRDANLLTSRGPQDMAAFIPAMLKLFDTKTSPQPTTSRPQRQSDPQLNAPPGVAVAALRWLPKPSAAAALTGIGLAAYARLALKSPLRKIFFGLPRTLASSRRAA